MKACTNCGEIKALSLFHKQAGRKDGLQTQCKDCRNKKVKAWRVSYDDKEQSRKYYRSNKNKIKERCRKYSVVYRKENSGKVNANNKKYQMMKAKRIPKWADLDAVRIIYETALPGEEVDHIVPLQGETVSGLHCEDNLQHLPVDENRSKGNRLWPDMW